MAGGGLREWSSYALPCPGSLPCFEKNCFWLYGYFAFCYSWDCDL